MGSSGRLEHVDATNEYFKAQIDLVPASYYFDKDTSEKLAAKRNQHMDDKIKNSVRKSGISNKSKLKRARLDPLENKKVSEYGADELTDSQSDAEMEVAEFPGSTDDIDDGMQEKSKPSVDDLRTRVRVRREALQAKRTKNLTPEEYMEKIRLRRTESKLKAKMKRKAAKEKVSVPKPNKGPHESRSNGVVSNEPEERPMSFSKFEFSQSALAASKSANKGKKRKNMQGLLKSAEAKKEKLKVLAETDPNKAQEVATKQSWTSALNKTKGIKGTDDTTLLKKSIKRREKQKKRSQKEWGDRQEKVEEKKRKAQDKRQKNIKTKKEARVTKKIKGAKKRGHILPGF